MILIGIGFLGTCTAVVGLGVMIVGMMKWRGRKLRLSLVVRSRGEGGVLLEAFAIFLTLFLLLPWLLRLQLASLPRWFAYGPALAALIMGMAWPLLRGMPRSQWSEALGLHGGQGWWREIGAGLLGWVAALPLMVVGMIAASWIMKLTGEFPSHPIVEVFAGDG